MRNRLLENQPIYKNSRLEIGKKEIKNYLAEVLNRAFDGHLNEVMLKLYSKIVYPLRSVVKKGIVYHFLIKRVFVLAFYLFLGRSGKKMNGYKVVNLLSLNNIL
ncbi:hypothetical protein [Cardinium endosymbiont of Oedothorax gibbosus]|uniref:hypothetical protein n=1 Tax=Cardinium endosymbiont of Oedothorax gibbosus TaxID=931101 RepID=UPI002023BE45|nr:hypothetical protein [Cardinium endosymbiont of Oedothorax gibbosus]